MARVWSLVKNDDPIESEMTLEPKTVVPRNLSGSGSSVNYQ